jgi:hypothetical protein
VGAKGLYPSALLVPLGDHDRLLSLLGFGIGFFIFLICKQQAEAKGK